MASFSIAKHLDCVLKSHNIENEEALIRAYRTKRDEIKNAIEQEFTSEIYAPMNSGSLKKHTAINLKYDLDIVVPFKKVNSMTLEIMFEKMSAFLSEKYRTETTFLGLRPQTVSLGVKFMVDGGILDFDIVPGREVTDYTIDQKLNLYVNQEWGTLAKGASHIQTNISKQIANIQENTEAREVIKLLKVWKYHSHYSVKSFFLELIAIRAFHDQTPASNSRWDKLKFVLQFIADHVQTIRLEDPGNSGNNVADTLTELQKSSLADKVKEILRNVEADSFNLETYFPINSKYPCEDDQQQNIYITSNRNQPDKLPNNDFGQ